MNIFPFCKRIWKAHAFSAEAFMARAAILVVLYAISRLAGLQEYTTFISGTNPNPNMDWQTGAAFGLVHLLLHFGFILLVPIFLITAGLIAAWNRWKPEQDVPLQENRIRH